MDKLVVYFSATGTTRGVAEKLSKALNAELFEIEPTKLYTKKDLNYLNPFSRTTKEMMKKINPEVKNKVDNLDQYKTIYIGFPVWWYQHPTIINTFLDENDLSGKELYIFVTSGSSSHAGSLKKLEEKYPNLNFINGKRLDGSETEEDLVNFFCK
ncbi:MAG: NAD(P)H-dependent oxidoreductase [Bacilli bacterium]|nr:NAD(P)H-dependent oxidoreductase [Bacilli bacterium]